MKEILVLYGGDTRGAAQFGALRYLHEQGYRPDVVLGVSIGAINGLFIAADRMDLAEEFWRTSATDAKQLATSPFLNKNGRLDLRELFKPRNWGFFTRHLFGKPIRALAEPTGLRSLLQQVCRYDLEARYLHQIVSLKTGKAYSLWENDFETDDDFISSIVASASIPGVFPPVPKIHTREETIYDAMDGGIDTSGPIDIALDLAASMNEPCRITAIPVSILNEVATDESDIAQIVQRGLSVLLHSRYREQMYNFLYHRSGKPPYRIIYPDFTGVPADFLAFSEEGIQRMMEIGAQAAREAEWVQ